MKVSCLQMNMELGVPTKNFDIAKRLITEAMKSKPDVLVLPETWNTGFFPKDNLADLSCKDGKEIKEQIGSLAKEYAVNIVAGSVSNLRGGRVYNTAYVFDREGKCITEYDKIHLFTPMGEDKFYTTGNTLNSFTLDGVKCSVIICYDLRFPELTRTLALQGLDMLFVVSQWPKARTFHLRTLLTARAIENQIFAVSCNSCGIADNTVFGGNSSIINPLGETLALAGETEKILSADCNTNILSEIRNTIPVFRDRRQELYINTLHNKPNN